VFDVNLIFASKFEEYNLEMYFNIQSTLWLIDYTLNMQSGLTS